MFFTSQTYPRIRYRYNNSFSIQNYSITKFSRFAYIDNSTSGKIIELFRRHITSNYYTFEIYIMKKYEDINIAFSNGYFGLYVDNGNLNFKCLIIKTNIDDPNSSITVDKNFYEYLKTKRKNKTAGQRFLEKCFNEIINQAIINNVNIIFAENIYLLNSGIDKLPDFKTLKEKKSFEESLYLGCQDLITLE